MNKIISKKYLYYIFFICIFIFFSCDHCNNQEFTIFYFCGNIEPNRPFDCAELNSLCMATEYDDTVFIASSVAEQIENAIMSAKSTNNHHSLSPVMYVNFGNSDLCLNGIDNQCWIKQDDKEYHPYILSNKVVYFLKWKSMYYNFLPHDILELDKGIQQYGIPSDYKKEYVNGTLKKKEASKILVRVR